MTINLQTGAYIPPQPLPELRGADIQVGQKQQQDTAILASGASETAVPPARSVDEKRYEKVLNAAQNLFKNVYVVSDKSFTIFKDSSGQYITRYTSLRDGRVTYIPEQRLLREFEATQSTGQAVLQIKA